MNIVITGGSGLLAGRLAKSLSNKHNISLVSRKNIKANFSETSLNTFIYRNVEDLKNVFKNQDIVVLAGGPNHNDSANKSIVDTYTDEIRDIISFINQDLVQKLIFLSSIRSVSENFSGDINENTTVKPSTPYGQMKASIENIVLNGENSEKMKRVVLRITNGYGFPIHNKTQCWDLVVMNVCRQAINKGNIKINGSGENFKDFLPISAIESAIADIISLNLRTNEVFNVSSGNSQKVIDFIRYVKELIEKRISLSIPLSIGESSLGLNTDKFRIDNSKLTRYGCDIDINHEREINSLIDFCVNNKESRG